MKKRLLSILLCLIMIVGLIPTVAFAADTAYDLWVSGVQVTSANKDNILGDSGTPTATYDPDTKALTLDGATLTKTHAESYAAAALFAEEDVTVVLKGTNTISLSSSTEGYGIYVFDSDFALTGEGDLGITIENSSYDGIWTDDCGLTIDMDGDLTIDAGQDGIVADGDITISGDGDLTVTSYEDGIQAYDGDVTISGDGNRTFYSTSDLTMSTTARSIRIKATLMFPVQAN